MSYADKRDRSCRPKDVECLKDARKAQESGVRGVFIAFVTITFLITIYSFYICLCAKKIVRENEENEENELLDVIRVKICPN
jgi:hypothetical protein